MSRWLRRLRILIACLVLVGAVAVFALGGDLGKVLAPFLAHTQLLPSFIRLIATGSILAGLSVLAILLLTLLAGRWYCACLCPLGVLQDVARAFGHSFRRLKRSQDRKDRNGYVRRAARTCLLVATIVSGTAGSLFLVNLIDPYSVFGRSATALLRPIVSLGRQGLSAMLEKADIYALAGASPVQLAWGTTTLVAVLLLVPVGMALFRGRLYCNSICPVGALLATLSRFSKVRVRTQEETCTGCGMCARQCRADCIVLTEDKKAQINAAECVLCLDCVGLCPTQALVYATDSPSCSAQTDGGRRELLALGTTAAAAIVALPLRSLASAGFVPEEAAMPVVPPGGISFDHFTSACTGCHLCVVLCPGRVLQPRISAHGGKGVFQPALDYLAGACDYDCNLCSQVCPNGAILPLTVPEKKRVQIGMVYLHEDRCAVYQRGEECGACVEVCPTHAVYPEDRDGILYPVTDGDLCVGCGACENVCPQSPRAITIEALALHGTALDPLANDHSASSAPDPGLAEEDFPF
ncbi:MAG: 4Fe-4S binding protein [Victivallales bacterium]|jgi:polyferredoxin|nr:4Fe-4S binding protein [Victivallales bacterium]MBT7304413.1 4Fe-4S binding protein [Victivallales bacterium]